MDKKKSILQGTDGYYKNQIDLLTKENRELKLKLDPLERENRALKKIVFDLSVKLDILSDSKRLGKLAPFDIDTALASENNLNSNTTSNVNNSSTIVKTGTTPVPTKAAVVAATSANTNTSTGTSTGAGTNANTTTTTTTTAGSSSSSSPLPTPATPAANEVSNTSNTSTAASTPAVVLATPTGTSITTTIPTVYTFSTAASDQILQSMRDSLSSSSVSVRDKLRDGRHFTYKYDLKGHTGAVYSIQYSPDGKILASGSFDKTVRLWDCLLQRQLACLEGHRVNISDLCWTNDSSSVLSASYDQTVKTWDINTSKLVSSFDVTGFALSVKIDPSNNYISYVGTSRNFIYKIDRRQSEVVAKFANNDAMVNSLYVFRDGEYLMSGDSVGNLKTWDVRNTSVFSSIVTDESKKAISHIQVSYRKLEDDDERYLAVNNYDNILRVYDRGSMPPRTQLSLIHAVKGHQNKNWPIKSCFFHGVYHKASRSQQSISSDGLLTEGLDSNSKIDDGSSKDKSIYSSLLLATGSADSSAYIFDVGGPEGNSELIQKLDGHTDRVYSVNFHPSDPILATASADASIKIWTARSTRPQIIDVNSFDSSSA